MKKLICLALAACVCLGLASCTVAQDVWLPDLELVTPAPTDSFLHHIVPREGDAVYMAWEYRPQRYDIRPGLSAAAPMWLYWVMGEDGPVLQDLKEMGYEDFDALNYVRTAHGNGCQVWATVVGFEPEATTILVNDEAMMRDFAQELAAYMDLWELDGINLDFEKMDPADTDRFTRLVETCKAAMGDKTLSVCVTVPVAGDSSASWYQSYDRAGIARVSDYLALMSYDGHKEGQIAPVAGSDWVRTRVEMLLWDVPSNKILLGVPMHGVAFVEEEGSEKAFDARLTLAADEVERLLTEDVLETDEARHEVESWLEEGVREESSDMLRYVFRDREGKTVTVYAEDPVSLAAKIDLVETYSLAGIAVWQKKGGLDPWWEAMRQGIEALNTP